MGEISAISNGGTYVVLVHFDALELNELLELSVQISPRSHAQRATITGLHFSAEMPGHSHGMVTAPVSDKVNRNLFSIEGINFHMPGLWRLYFDIESEDITERAQFDLFVR